MFHLLFWGAVFLIAYFSRFYVPQMASWGMLKTLAASFVVALVALTVLMFLVALAR